ncbi:MAG: FHA domain-containing protein [Polyangia bacterium]|jgi:hypothetical protein|nr:FHA domain-containing protein [Polyangia bacterium]
MDQSKKTMRHFYCRDVLWDTFEQMANDFDCSIDYLINEAMRYYARSKNYMAAGGTQESPRAAVVDPAPAKHSGRPVGQAARALAEGETTPAPQAASPARSGRQQPAQRGAPPPPPGMRRQASSGAAAATPARLRTPAAEPAAAAVPTLYLIFNNERLPIDKDQFIIGRGSKTADLPIKDGNISRKHAAVIRRNGVYYIKDLGSTNGIDYKGMRIDNKRIDEGDVFHLCDYELKFTFRS